jgi:hypothetical protein
VSIPLNPSTWVTPEADFDRKIYKTAFSYIVRRNLVIFCPMVANQLGYM